MMDPNSPHGAYIAAAQALRGELNQIRDDLGQSIQPISEVPNALGQAAAMAATAKDEAEKGMHQAGQALGHLSQSGSSLANGTVISPMHPNMERANTYSLGARDALQQAGTGFSSAQELYDTGKVAVANTQGDLERDIGTLTRYIVDGLDQAIGLCSQAEQAAGGGGYY